MPKPILIEVGAGELIDKWTILKIKEVKISDASKLENIRRELNALQSARTELITTYPNLTTLENELQSVNSALWVIEDDIRICEKRKDFGAQFIDLARSVYVQNDLRANLKKKINILCEAELIEEKSYEEF